MKQLALLLSLAISTHAFAQTQTTGQISGTVKDSSGAVVPKAAVTVVNLDTRARRETASNDQGYYIVPLLDPGRYRMMVQAPGFQTVSQEVITVEVAHSPRVDFELQVGKVEQTIDVKSDASLFEPSNPSTTTTFSARQLADLPNPGNDLSYLANLASGALVNTIPAIGARSPVKVQFNGLPAIANNFTIDGVDANDPFFNLNSTGASGLQLGLNAVQEVSVNTLAYSADQGLLAGAQINYVTKSGTNTFHGNAYEVWNGAAMNARNFFLNASPTPKPKPASNVNQFGGSFGGPLVKNKLFFFADIEAIRLILPVVLTSTLPSPAYQSFVLQQLPLGGRDTVLGTQLPPQPGEVALYKTMFGLMGDTSQGVPLPKLGCPFDVGGGQPAIPNTGNGCANVRTFSVSPPANETLFTIKLDYNHDAMNSFWYRFQLNNGSRRQADPVNPIFDLITDVPVRSGAAGWTHVLGPNLVNQFNPGFAYRSAIRNLADPPKVKATFPIAYLVSPFSTIGVFSAPSGAATTTWQLNDNLSWTRGKHAFKFGVTSRRVLTSLFSGTPSDPEPQ